jgi:hypothetical protein
VPSADQLKFEQVQVLAISTLQLSETHRGTIKIKLQLCAGLMNFAPMHGILNGSTNLELRLNHVQIEAK